MSVPDQHAVVERWHGVADELAEALGNVLADANGLDRYTREEALGALGRYVEARDG